MHCGSIPAYIRGIAKIWKMSSGDVIEFRTACGGGYGDPLERDPELVLRDVRADLVSVESALRDYGVAMDGRTLALDLPATERERGSRR